MGIVTPWRLGVTRECDATAKTTKVIKTSDLAYIIISLAAFIP